MAKIKKGRDLDRWKSNQPEAQVGKLRLIGGIHRGQQIAYSGDPITRPMKDNIREAVFNLVGGWIPGKLVFDLFAGTGAIGIEALSREAKHATFIERHFPTSKIIRQNLESLHIATQATLESSDTFFRTRQFFKNLPDDPTPWAVFCSPPYDFFVERKAEMLELIERFKQHAPPKSLIVVESDDRFDPGELPEPDQWNIRQYAPALVAVWRDRDDEFEDETAASRD